MTVRCTIFVPIAPKSPALFRTRRYPCRKGRTAISPDPPIRVFFPWPVCPRQRHGTCATSCGAGQEYTFADPRTRHQARPNPWTFRLEVVAPYQKRGRRRGAGSGTTDINDSVGDAWHPSVRVLSHRTTRISWRSQSKMCPARRSMARCFHLHLGGGDCERTICNAALKNKASWTSLFRIANS